MEKFHYIIIAIIAAAAAYAYINIPQPACGFTNCHGLEPECGNPVQQCDLVYQYGDNCRRFAHCKYEGSALVGSCQLIKENRFEECKSCVAKCLQDYGSEDIRSFECEYKCTL